MKMDNTSIKLSAISPNNPKMTCGQLDCALQKAASDRGHYVKKLVLYGICLLLSIKWMNILEPNVFLFH